MEHLPEDFFVTSMQFTKNAHRDEYPAINPSSPELSQAGKVVIITGASKGVGGRGFVPSFARAGAKAIVLVARNPEQLKEVETQMSKQYPQVQFLSVPTDISDTKSIENLFGVVKDKFGHGDVLVNNAAALRAVGPVKDVNASDWWSDFQTNTYGPFLICQQFLKLLPADAKATIINMVSGLAYQVQPTLSAYGISKLATLELTTYIAVENPNITAIALHPGVVHTEQTMDSFVKFAKDTPELVGGIATWLSTPRAHFLSGRFVAANWDVDDLVAREEEIKSKDLLKMFLTGTFGVEQFK